MKIVSNILANVRKEDRKNLLESEAKTICREYNIPITRFKIAKTKVDAIKFAQEIGFPTALKIVSPDIIHKTDAGGIMLNLKSIREIEKAYKTILDNAKNYNPTAKIVGLLIEEMVPSSTEVIVGAIKDPQFGPAIMFGLGGILVEVLEDVAFRIAPVSRHEAELMITEIKAFPVLKGYRNKPPLDTNAVAEIIVNTSKLVMDYQEIEELDLNPIMVYEKGAKAVDARIILE